MPAVINPFANDPTLAPLLGLLRKTEPQRAAALTQALQRIDRYGVDVAAIESGLSDRCGSCDEVMVSASQLLSLLTGAVGFALAPESSRTRVWHIEFVRLPFPRILALVISDVTGDDPTHIASGPCSPDLRPRDLAWG